MAQDITDLNSFVYYGYDVRLITRSSARYLQLRDIILKLSDFSGRKTVTLHGKHVDLTFFVNPNGTTIKVNTIYDLLDETPVFAKFQE